ncbi:hypothetical protein G3567_13220 [Psychroflexus sp. YR1-1]|uniref:Uncharacterized protein n=1 Tax=Psychroflexus aurantiacus TaxID=2709310 RepID=A0A6B3R364_9FLAO|nr:DUF6624 domain-containing protein [Psychroflexus aurantiacus]NEV95096.1 hypothetical protein [Psychroflexus aurantiacus]
MKYTLIFIFSFLSSTIYSQSINTELKARLDSILVLDQAPRALMDPNISDELKTKYLGKLGLTEDEYDKNKWGIVIKYDSINLKRVEKIINEYGYPGKSLVGEPTNRAVWYVIQHSDKIAKYLPIIKEAGEKGEIPMTSVAMMEDRFLMESGKEQVYGTQVWGGDITDEKTGKKKREYIVWPIKNPKNINEIRKSAGFKKTIEEYALDLDVEYKIYTLEQVKLMFDKFKN